MEEVKLDEKPRKENPVDKTNIFSKIFFCWFLPYFITGYKRELTEDDIFQHKRKHDSKTLGDKLAKAWKTEITEKKSPSLISALFNVFGLELFLCSFIIIGYECVRLAHPLLISKLLHLYQLLDSKDSQNEIYLYATLIVVVSFCNILFIHSYNLLMSEISLKMGIACSSMIYRKTLKLNRNVLINTTIGKMVNLLANDIGSFNNGLSQVHHCWLSPIMGLLVIYLTYSSYGIVGMSGMLVVIGAIPIQIYMGKKSSEYHLSIAARTDERVRLMNEIITGIQLIKMYTWEKPFAKLVETARLKEIKIIRFFSVINGFLMSTTLCNNRISISVAIIAYVATGNSLTSTYAYTITSYYRIMNSFNMFFPQAISKLSELTASVQRIQKFLLLDEKIEDNNLVLSERFISLNQNERLDEKPSNNDYFNDNKRFKLTNVFAKWNAEHPEYNIENISMHLSSGELVVVVGQVGSGKSSLLQVILKELVPSQGIVEVLGRVSYASQEPWLFGGTVRQNIIFGQDFNQKRYEEIIRICALERDLNLLPYGDKTRIGERGVTLSGGQRARVNLARAVYKEADIYLLDDPLSAVDTHVGKQLFDDCISEFLSNKCVVLVTHQLQYLKNIRNIYVLAKGAVISSGSYENIKNSNSIFTKLLTDLEKNEEEESKTGNKESIGIEKNVYNAPGLKKEIKSTGKVTGHVYKSYFKAGGHLCNVVLVVFGFIFSQTIDSFSEYFVTIWVNIQQWKDQNKNTNLTFLKNESGMSAPQLIPVSPYNHQWFVDIFSNNSTVYIYGVLLILLILVTVTRTQIFYCWCLKCSTTLHNKMFGNLIYSPMEFFNNNPSGRILNRFSYDIGNIDESLSLIFLDTMQIGLCVVSTSLIIGTLSPWIFIPTVVILILFYFMRIIFLETSRDVKRIEAVNRSPIFSHLAASVHGLTTIRAFGAQVLLSKEFDDLQNLHSGAFYMFLGAARTFGFWLDFNCIVYIALVLMVLLLIKGETFGGNIGLALTQSMTLTGMFQWGIRQWSEMENKMTSVERIQEYTELPKEIENEIIKPHESWPHAGEIVFNNLSLRYSKTLPYVLKNVSFSIESKEKVGVVGRTGAGKSSLIQALFRLTYIEGSIIIDGVNTQAISLNTLRSKISIIPQEPVLFTGTLRKNLDPFHEYTDEVLWRALEEVELKSAVSDLPDGLDNKIAEGGVNFSLGQRQLLCLARAIIRQNKILILDEATANVDLHTDSLIQRTIRRKCGDCTVITIAHRLHSIIDSDKILVIDAGELLEYDSPHSLLQNKDGVFYSLLMQSGASTAKNLMELANSSYSLKN